MGTIMDDDTRAYRAAELLPMVAVALAAGYAQLKITGEGGESKWLRITATELSRIVATLTGSPEADPREVYAVQRETVDGLFAFEREPDRDAYVALLEAHEVGEAEPLTINVMGPRQAELFLAEEAESLAEDAAHKINEDVDFHAMADDDAWDYQP